MIFVPARPTVPEDLEEPYTCDDEGWSEWYNLNSPDPDGEFESLSEIRKVSSSHYIMVILQLLSFFLWSFDILFKHTASTVIHL